MPQPDALAAYSVVVLRHAGRFLLLQRSPDKRVHPNRWSGVGGRVEPHELDGLHASALRELTEETGFTADDVEDFCLRRVLLMRSSVGSGLTVLLYFTGDLRSGLLPDCPEGILHWVSPEEFASLEVIESTRGVLPLLATDMASDPSGLGGVRFGLYHCAELTWVG